MPEQPTPLTIRLYDAEGEYTEFSQMIIPWGIMKMAISITETMNNRKLAAETINSKNAADKGTENSAAEKPDANNATAEDMDALAGLVVATFGNRFTVEQLNNGADVSEMLAVINNIVARAGNLMKSNPTRPG